MKFNYNLFSYTFFLICCAVQHNAFALNNTKCLTGGIYEYCGWGSQCKQCPANCYCPPVAKSAVECTGWTAIYCRSDYGIKSNTNAAITNGKFGINLCPADYPNSDVGANSAEKCYWKCREGTKHAGQVLYNKAQSCSSGQYRPKGTNECKSCPDDGKSVCTGVSSFKPLCAGADSDQGIKKCDSGMVPNSNKTSCVKAEAPKYKCGSGEYLPANSTSCAACPEDAKCEGGEWEKRTIDQGIKKKNSVPAGYYLPAGQTQPVTCKTEKSSSGAFYYCPGGDYMESNKAQGLFECPKSAPRPNKEKSACIMTIKKENMKACWMEAGDPEKYRTCVFSGRYYK